MHMRSLEGENPMATCVLCDENIPDQAQFCGKCGAEQPAIEVLSTEEASAVEVVETVQEEKPDSTGLKPGIRGWLVFPAIGLILSLVGSPILAYFNFSMASETYNDALRLGLGLEGVESIGSFIFALIAVGPFFRKQVDAPDKYKMMMWFGIVMSVISGLALVGPTHGKSLGGAISGIIGAAVWIAYFNKSKRVAATFVNISRSAFEQEPAPNAVTNGADGET
jgi:hypothetical protein